MRTKGMIIFKFAVFTVAVILNAFSAKSFARSHHKQQCNTKEFTCDSGQCIEVSQQCDGSSDCQDGSDETARHCSNINCPTYMYRCKYGGCVLLSSICNGVVNCVDGSDEAPINSCKLPRPYEFSNSMTSSMTITTKRYTPFPFIPNEQSSTTTRVSSHKPPSISTSPTTKRYTPFPGGIKTTPTVRPFTSPITTVVVPSSQPTAPPAEGSGKCVLPEQTDTRTYTVNNCVGEASKVDVRCNLRAGDVVNFGTVLYFQCSSLKYSSFVKDIFSSYCFDGAWTPPIADCIPCGTLNPENGNDEEIPWQATIHQKSNSDSESVCKASIISPYVLISAAHCFFDVVTQTKKKDTQFYVTINGGRNQNLNSDPIREYNVSKVTFSTLDGFQGPDNNYANDIAVLEISPGLQYSSSVNPVCMELNDQLAELENKGLIVPYKSAEKDSNRRRETVSFSSYEHCIQSVSEPFKQVVTTDKLCILDQNVEIHSDGRGLYTRRNEESVYRLRGVFSSMFLDSINSKQVLTITDTTKHLSWMNNVIDEINQRRRIEDTIDVRFSKKTS